MSVRVAINGFGRIGRSVYRIAADRKDIEFVGVNDITQASTLSYLLRYDTVMGTFEHPVKLESDTLFTAEQETKMISEKDPARLPWKDLNIDIVVEATGRFRKREEVEKHLAAGAGHVILTVPPKDALDAMVVLGVNDSILKKEHKLISNASCTTNCLAPMAKTLHENFGIEYGVMTTVHAYTNDQRLSDMYHHDLRRARAANENIIPTTTGAAKAVGKILPDLNGKLDGMAMRIPLPNGSIVDLVAKLSQKATPKKINQVFHEQAQSSLKGILQYSEEPLVSSDIIGNPHSCIFDAPFTRVLKDRFVKVVGWYDNEWGYSNRVVNLIEKLSKL